MLCRVGSEVTIAEGKITRRHSDKGHSNCDTGVVEGKRHDPNNEDTRESPEREHGAC